MCVLCVSFVCLALIQQLELENYASSQSSCWSFRASVLQNPSSSNHLHSLMTPLVIIVMLVKSVICSFLIVLFALELSAEGEILSLFSTSKHAMLVDGVFIFFFVGFVLAAGVLLLPFQHEKLTPCLRVLGGLCLLHLLLFYLQFVSSQCACLLFLAAWI